MASVCPYCRTPIEEAEAVLCEGCGTPHHSECLQENGGCTLFGCRFAPPDDPKVQVTVGDVAHAAVYAGAPSSFSTATGFGDVNAPAVFAAAPGFDVAPPPPPPPPGMEFVPPAEPSPVPPTSSTLFAAPVLTPKSRLTYILLGIFLGSFGAHNFYAGYRLRGVTQLGLTVGTLFYGTAVTWIWALVEVCTVDRDHDNVSFI
jgi:TM2 domain-containing membrane protein YozV